VISKKQSLTQVLAAVLGTIAGVMTVGHALLYWIENGVFYRMIFNRWYRRQRGFLARYVPKLQAAFLAMSIEGRDATETAGFLWARLHKDYHWRISDRHLQRQLFEYNNAVTLEDVRDAITEFDTDNDGLIDYCEFMNLLSLVGVLPLKRLTGKVSKDFFEDLKNASQGKRTMQLNEATEAALNLEKNHNNDTRTGNNDSFKANMMVNNELRELDPSATASHQHTTSQQSHDWASSLISATKLAGFQSKTSTILDPPSDMGETKLE